MTRSLFRWLLIGTAVSMAALHWKPSRAAPATPRITLLDFEEGGPAVNQAGDGYPTFYDGRSGSRGEGGLFTTEIDPSDAFRGRSLRLRLTEGAFYAQFNPYDREGNRGFAREYTRTPAGWKFNTYNRMRLWIKLPEGATPHRLDGRSNLNVGTYVKRVAGADPRSDESGGNHYYHNINVPALGAWTQVVLNMHPDHRRGNDGNIDLGELPHPTGEQGFNYFDTLTRFYIQDEAAPAKHPADYRLDEIEFYQETAQENDEQVYSLTETYLPTSNRLIISWRRNKKEGKVRHEIRYAFQDLHHIGWSAAVSAPGGLITPPGTGGYNGMVYDTTLLPLQGQKLLYLGIKPEGSQLFSQIAVPLR